MQLTQESAVRTTTTITAVGIILSLHYLHSPNIPNQAHCQVIECDDDTQGGGRPACDSLKKFM